MRVLDHAGVTDPGRKRRRNEDAFVIDPPLFVVADGMGGAQAGEVASRLAATAFREFHDADDLNGEERVEAIIQEANRRIFERAQHDTAVSGMGTTVTAALVEGETLAVGHVGDSRLYRVRGGELEQLTNDHSLVADLMRSGRLTQEEADTHPQRSVITRALGTDPEVDVDTFAVEVEPGDTFLLCSDGLTTMVGDEEILRVVREGGSLASTAKALVKAANRHGGEDNITVVLFSLEAGEGVSEETAALAADGQGEVDDLEDTLSGLEPLEPTEPVTTVGRPIVERPPAQDEEGEPVVEGPGEPEGGPPPGRDASWEPLEEPAPPRERRRPRRKRRLLLTVLAVALVAALLLVALWAIRNGHFVGAEEDGRLAVYQGLPYDLGGGVSLYRARYVSPLRAAQLSQEERRALLDHDLMSYDAARERLAALEDESLP